MNATDHRFKTSDWLVRRLQEILGADGVLADADAIERVTRTCVPFRTIPSVVVYPSTSEQVQAVVLAAAEADTPLWPVSTGKNWGYGARSAAYDGGVTILLERMTQIVHVDEELAYAVIEPGVTYQH